MKPNLKRGGGEKGKGSREICSHPFTSAPFLLCLLLLAGCVSTPDGKKPLFVPVGTNELGQVTYEVNPGINNAIRTGQQIGQQILPAPWGAVTGAALGLLSAGMTWYAKRKSTETNVLIAGIEAAPNNESVKTSIYRIASATGVEKRLNKLVKQTASDTAKRDFGK